MWFGDEALFRENVNMCARQLALSSRKGGEKESKRKTFRNGTWYFEEGWEAGGGARDVIICLFRG